MSREKTEQEILVNVATGGTFYLYTYSTPVQLYDKNRASNFKEFSFVIIIRCFIHANGKYNSNNLQQSNDDSSNYEEI
jgi:hypothetical protein